MLARIYRPAKTAVSSGRHNTTYWVLEYEVASRREPDRLIGWVGSDDTQEQVKLRFPNKEAAVAYAERNDIPHTVSEPHERVVRPKSYAENFTRPVRPSAPGTAGKPPSGS